MKKREARLFFVATLLLTDALMAGTAFYCAYWIRLLVPIPAEAVTLAAPAQYAPVMIAHMVSVLLALAFNRLYVLARSPSRVDEFYQTIGASTGGTIAGVALSYFLYKNTPLEVDYPRAMILYAWLLTIILVTVGRLTHGRLRAALQARGWGRDRVLIVGTGDVARMILHKILGNPGLGYQVVGAVEVDGYPSVALPAPVIGNARDLARLIEEHQVDEVIIALPEATHQEILSLIAECERGKATIKVFPDLFQIIAGPMSIGDLGGLPLLTIRDIALRGWRRTVKRLMDIVGATVGLIFLSPLMLLVAVLIKLDSPGPAFYVQERMGLDAKPFPMLKFRSMRQDAEAKGPGWTRPGDPRVTRIGSILRRLNVDELPQLINVLLGEMSLVGPRPERPVYVAQFRRSIPRYMDRHREKAGMTGWAQVNGLRGDTSIAERTKYDLWYIENWSLLLDIKILLRTLINIFRSPNAY
ncbi:MAG: undecaprenyl-phosphate glucose phosphotransferase [Anaerolineae bacterium]|nr:undecaprenyl-phosphate glucose phosphotransferase [Anaerolineae bacterium]MCX8066469.1 undecaprenyl-phosphate glucose phosphotransferase [Anaerolineae bacterium]